MVSVLLAFIPLLFRLYNTTVSIVIFSAFGSGYVKSRFLESILFFPCRIRILLRLMLNLSTMANFGTEEKAVVKRWPLIMGREGCEMTPVFFPGSTTCLLCQVHAYY